MPAQPTEGASLPKWRGRPLLSSAHSEKCFDVRAPPPVAACSHFQSLDDPRTGTTFTISHNARGRRQEGWSARSRTWSSGLRVRCKGHPSEWMGEGGRGSERPLRAYVSCDVRGAIDVTARARLLSFPRLRPLLFLPFSSEFRCPLTFPKAEAGRFLSEVASSE